MIKLYDHPLSPYAQKVRMALREKGVGFETVVPGGLGAGGAAEDFRAASPRAEVPAFIEGDHRPEWMIKSGGVEVVLKGLKAGNIRFAPDFD